MATDDLVTGRGGPLPIDPAIRSWVVEAGIHLDGPWVYLGMIGRSISPDDDMLRFDMVYHHPSTVGAYRSFLHVPRDTFGTEWDGYRIELLGGVRHLSESGFQITPPVWGDPQGPLFKVLSGPDDIYLEIELWRQRCYRPGRDQRGIPGLVAEVHWWPDSPIAHPFFRTMAAAPNQLGQDDLRTARKDWTLLQDFPLTVNRGGGPKGPRKGEIWTRRQCLEWWDAWKIDRTPGLLDLAAAMGVTDPETAGDRWRSTGLSWHPTEQQLHELREEG